MSDPEDLVLVHLREFRADLNACFDALDARFDAFGVRIEGRFDAIDCRLDAIGRTGKMALREFNRYCATVERRMASFEGEIGGLKKRIKVLESVRI